MPSSPFDSGADAPLTVTADSAWTRPHPVTSDSTCSTTTTTATVHTPLTPPLTPTKPLVRCPSPSRSPSPSPTDLAAPTIQNVYAIQAPPRRPSASDPYHRYEHGAGQDPTDRALASNASITSLARTTTTTSSHSSATPPQPSTPSPPPSPLPLPTIKFETMDARTSEIERAGTAERERDWSTAREQARAALGGRARALRLNTLQKRGHHPDELSPLPLPYPSSPAHPSSSPPPASSSYPTSSSSPSFSYPLHPHQHHLPSSSSDSRLSYPYAYDPSHPSASLPAPSPSKSKFLTLHPGHSSPLLRRLYALPLVHRIRTSALVRRASKISSALPRLPASTLPLILYFALNLSLTLYNKAVLVRFPFPYTLTALHALCGSVGTGVWVWLVPGVLGAGVGATDQRPGGPGVRALQRIGPPRLNGRERFVLFLFSILYTLNIVVSNASLRLVTVPFHQVVRSSTPFFTILLSAILLGKRSSRAKLLSLVPVVVGVGFATYGDYYFTVLGFALTLLGTLLAAMKTVVTNIILVKPGSAGSGAGDGFGSSLPTAHSRHPSTTQSHSRHPSLGHSQYPTPVSPLKPLVLLAEAGEPGVYQQREPSPQSAFSALPPRQTPQTVFEEPTLRQRLGALLALAVHRVNALFPPPSPGSQPLYGYGYGYSYGEKPYASQPYPFPQTPTGLTRGTVPMSAYAPYPSLTPSPWSGTLFAALPKLSLTPIHLLYLLSPLAFIETTLLAQVSGELGRVRGVLSGHGHGHGHDLPGTAASWAGGAGGSTRTWLLLNGVMAFFLNVVSFHANRRVGPVGMSVAANVKQVLTILCAVGLFDLTMTPANALGIVLTLVGGALYARVEVREREQERRRKN